ncbi:hypothetical protein U8C31_18205 [Sinorhizobium medicae]|uniref:hypothetical protein n=1 Tax=Sinorhizobium medicae TaxID=110321 RepID=UPI002AF6B8D3|nr:hypothetical protein [Sinorhizobium medicae]WQO72170.1 hypothetical protein U8C31_18205 [Sinorhizobium medicae]
MPIEDLRARQRQSIIRSQQHQLGLDCSRDMEMKPENIEKLQTLHGKNWHQSAANLPDGWTEIVGNFFSDLDDIGDLVDAVSVRFERCPDGVRAFAFPEMSQWHPQQMHALRIAQRVLLLKSRETCEWCAKPDAEPVPLGERVTLFLCEEHKAKAEAKLAAQVQAFDERVKFRDEMATLFQPMSVMSLQVTDLNLPILRKALRDIKRIVEERNLVGHVYITKVLEDEGQLFITARYDNKVDPATNYEIEDIIHHAQWQSDQLSVAASKEDGNADDA